MSDLTQPSPLHSSSVPVVLTIAGSDSSGGAGIQADIKAISATGGYACSVITAITAQNTVGVSGVFPVPAEFVAKQLDAVFTDLNIAAVKIGMLADCAIIRVVADKLRQYRPSFVVVDPVMVATSGDPLLQDSAIRILKDELFPLADLVTPNIPEGAVLTGMPLPVTANHMTKMISGLCQLGVKAVLLKGGHLEQNENSNDLLIFPEYTKLLTAKRIHSTNTHGTGCTLSSAIASYFAQGYHMLQAVTLGKIYISQAIVHADQLKVGHGHGPVHHFFCNDRQAGIKNK